MFVFAQRPSDDEVLGLVTRWVEELARGRFSSAMELLAPSEDQVWDAEAFDRAVWLYQPPAKGAAPLRVSSPTTARQSDTSPRRTVHWYPPNPCRDPQLEAFVSYDLSLNGTWRDLTALFWLKRLPEGYVLALEDLHTL